MSFTIKNLREVEDVAPRFGFDQVQEARFPWRALEAEQTGMAYHVIKPDQRGGAHRHDQAEEIYLVLSGSGRIKLDDEVRQIGPMDAIRISPQVKRAFAAGPEGLELLVFGPHHEADGEILKEDVWADEA
jgi:quercetin dioxygenase-like cupin family protein